MQARNTLMNIDDTDAIPALSTHLGSNRNEEARHLYVVILHNMKGPKPVYYLVALSLFDESLQIRSEARKAIREDQLDSARMLYIAALRSAPPKLARVAAVGLGEIGDPRGDSIPFLINALVSYGTVATMTEPSPICTALHDHDDHGDRDAGTQFFRTDLQYSEFRNDL
jgi:HEAT repeat protein